MSNGNNNSNNKVEKPSRLLVQTEKEVTSDEAKIEINNVRTVIKHMLILLKKDDENRKEECRICTVNFGWKKGREGEIAENGSGRGEGEGREEGVRWERGERGEGGRKKYMRKKKPKSGHMYIYWHTYKHNGVSQDRWRFIFNPLNIRGIGICKTFSTIGEAVKARDEYFADEEKID